MKRLSPVFALTALAAATVAIAQQTPPSAEPPSNTNQSQSQGASPSAMRPSDARNESRKADKQELMTNCITRVQADNPIATAKEIKDVCKKRVNSYSSPQSPQH